ncbi:ribosome biogenesis GTP-binding protein YihA/YsxC [Mycoplasma sp. 4044]
MWNFIKSADKMDSWYQHNNEEIAFWGRSNVGKSSLLNALANQKIAKVSSTPGRTRLLNYFQTDNQKIIVDLPGYGFAKMSASEQVHISKMIANYLEKSKNLTKICVLIDSKIGITPIDSEMIDYCTELNLEILLVATKIDKANQKQLHQTKKDIQTLYRDMDIIFVSSKNKKNLELLKEKIAI